MTKLTLVRALALAWVWRRSSPAAVARIKIQPRRGVVMLAAVDRLATGASLAAPIRRGRRAAVDSLHRSPATRLKPPSPIGRRVW